MLNYNEITPRKFVVIDGDPYEVLTSHVFRKQQRKPVNATKLKNLITGKVLERSFHQAETIEEADLGTKEAKYIYSRNGKSTFCSPKNPSDRFELDDSMIGEKIKYLKSNDIVETLLFEDKIIGVKIPIKVELKVKTAPPAVRGNTAQGATKEVELETGAKIQVPLFIKEGEVLRINTDTGEYVERA
ncbi:MAG TPA: elongation factor P [Candidatus Paceibacterota bacterium]|nr:elongation factor P [Candidatus Paceibacterota bacterium]